MPPVAAFRQLEDGMRKYISVWKARQAEIIGHGVVLKVLLASLALAVIAWIIVAAMY